MKAPNMAPDGPGGSRGSRRSRTSRGSGGSGDSPPPEDSSANFAQEWLQDKLLNDIQTELGNSDVLPQDLALFWGFAADAGREGYARLYLNLQFNEYIEFETSAIVFSKDLGGQDRPFSGIAVWLRRSTTIQHVRVESLDLQRNFLQGTIPPAFGNGGTSGSGGGSMVCGGGGSMVCGGGGSMVCGGGGSMVCNVGSMVCGGGGSMVCGAAGSMVCGGGGSMVCGGGY
jgi:hypothetical protein